MLVTFFPVEKKFILKDMANFSRPIVIYVGDTKQSYIKFTEHINLKCKQTKEIPPIHFTLSQYRLLSWILMEIHIHSISGIRYFDYKTL